MHDEREIRKMLLGQLITEMDKQELSRIPSYAEPVQDAAEAEAESGQEKMDPVHTESTEMKAEADEPIMEGSQDPDEEEENMMKPKSRAAGNLSRQMNFIK